MSKFIDLTNQKFGKLTVIKRISDRISKNGQHKTMFLCKCDCGNEVCVEGSKLRRAHTKSCGCLHKEIFAKITSNTNFIHGSSNTRLYHIWENMKTRCYNKNSINFQNYGGRGIFVCDEWQEFKPFYNWAIKNGYQNNLTIDRIDVNGNYEPLNCKWTTMKTQQNNRRNNKYYTYKNETHTLTEWAIKINIPPTTLYSRIKRGWTIERALTTF